VTGLVGGALDTLPGAARNHPAFNGV